MLNYLSRKHENSVQIKERRLNLEERKLELEEKKDGIKRHEMEDDGRFPFDQKFRFEIPGIPCDEWNSIFRLVGQHVPKFRAKIRNKQRGNKYGRLCASFTCFGVA